MQAGPAPEPQRRWELSRHCRLRLDQLLAGCALPCVLGLLAGLGFAAWGYPGPLAFAVLQAAGVALAFIAHARRRGARAVLTLRDGWLEVVKRRGSRQSVTRFPLACLHMQAEPEGLHFECGASNVRVHGYATPAACAQVLRQLQQARRDAAIRGSTPARRGG